MISYDLFTCPWNSNSCGRMIRWIKKKRDPASSTWDVSTTETPASNIGTYNHHRPFNPPPAEQPVGASVVSSQKIGVALVVKTWQVVRGAAR